MKKLTLLFLVFSIMIFGMEIPVELTDYINVDSNSKKIEFMDIPVINQDEDYTHPEFLTIEQALEDLVVFKYIVDNGYSGKEYWENKGIKVEERFKKLEFDLQLLSHDISFVDYINAIASVFQGVSDGHLSLSCNYGSLRFFSHNSVHFTDVLVEKQQNSYIVIKSNFDNIKVGSKYTGEKENLFKTLSPEGKAHFLLGKFSKTKLVVADFEFNNIKFSLPVHVSRIREAIYDNTVYSKRNITGIPVLRVANFNTNFHSELEKFVSEGNKLKNEKNIIVDINFNGGGSSNYSERFIKDLNNIAIWSKAFARLESPVTTQAWAKLNPENYPPFVVDLINVEILKLKKMYDNPVRKWSDIYSAEPHQVGDFKGNLFIISNRYVASSGEAFLNYSKNVKNSFIVGENSGGVGNFGEINSYYLPNSQIFVNIPEKLFIAAGIEEGKGYVPDYWLDSSEPVKELINYINFPESYCFELSEKPEVKNIDMENWKNGLPVQLEKEIGATNGSGKSNIFEMDTVKKYTGNASLKISGDIETNEWYLLSQKIPHGLKKITAKFAVSAENLAKEGNQFGNSYIGFIFNDKDGNYKFKVKHFTGTFDWKNDSITLEIEKEEAYNVNFIIFSSVSGIMWVDDVTFETREKRV